ncbi:MAG: hypothetical protein ACYDEX_15395 [Mobilitalea sp.]
MISKLSKSSLRSSTDKKPKYYLVILIGSIICFLLLFFFGFRIITKINTDDKNQEALQTVIYSLFTCPDSDWIQNFQNDKSKEAGNEEYIKDSMYSKEYLKKLEEIYSPYFTDKMYKRNIPLYVNLNQATAFHINYQVNVDHIDIVQDKKDPRSYTFTIFINYGPVDGKLENTEVTGKAQCLEKGKISFLRFNEDFSSLLMNIENRELTIENVINKIFNCPDQEQIRLNEVMLEEMNQASINGEVYLIENSELHQKQDELYQFDFTEAGYETFVRSTMPLRYHFGAEELGYTIVVDHVDIIKSEQFETNYSFTIHLLYGQLEDDKKEYELEGSVQFIDQFSSISNLQIFNEEFDKILWGIEEIKQE